MATLAHRREFALLTLAMWIVLATLAVIVSSMLIQICIQ